MASRASRVKGATPQGEASMNDAKAEGKIEGRMVPIGLWSGRGAAELETGRDTVGPRRGNQISTMGPLGRGNLDQ